MVGRTRLENQKQVTEHITTHLTVASNSRHWRLMTLPDSVCSDVSVPSVYLSCSVAVPMCLPGYAYASVTGLPKKTVTEADLFNH